MNLRKSQPLDLVGGAVISALILMIASVILLGSWMGVRVSLINLEQRGIGPYGPIVISFSSPVNQTIAQALFSITPKVNGQFQWPDARTLRFIPLNVLQRDIDYRVTISPGPLGNEGLFLRQEHHWSLRVRKSQIVYLLSMDNKTQFWIVDTDGGSPRQLGNFDKAIIDFDVAPNGEFIIFSALNDKQGLDLWYLDRTGTTLHLFLDCGAGRCTTPTISPDSQQVAYTREAASISPSLPPGAPRIWVADVQGRENRPLYADPQVIGYGPEWSPDGAYLTSYDGIQDIIQVVTLKSGNRFALPSVTGDQPSWSPDSKHILFTDMAETPDGLRTQVKLADVEKGEISIWMGKEDDRDYQYGELAWSPTSNDILIGLQSSDITSRGLLLLPSDQLSGSMIADDPGYVYDMPRWDLWGKAIIFLQEQIKGNHLTQIAIWEDGQTQLRILAQGSSPHWLP